MRSDRNRAGSRKNKTRKHHGKKGRRHNPVAYHQADDHWNQPVEYDRRQELLARPNQEPTSTPIEQFWGPRELIKMVLKRDGSAASEHLHLGKPERGSLVGQLDEHLQSNG